MEEQKKPPTDQERIARLERLVIDQARTIQWMQKLGGFTDAKTLGVRCTRIERRLELLELDGDMLKDTMGMAVASMEAHLVDRHQANFARFDGNDVSGVSRIRRRLAEWAEKRGLMSARRDVSDARKDEGRVRPRRDAATA